MKPVASQADRRSFRLPFALCFAVARSGGPLVVQVEGQATELALDIESSAGQRLATQSVTANRATGLWLPRHAARLTLRGPGAETAGLSYYPLQLWRLTCAALISGAFPGGVKGAYRAARRQRRRLKEILWSSSAAAPMGLNAYRSFRTTYVGDYQEVVAPEAGLRLHFVSQAADVALDRLAACATALSAQTDTHFRWHIGVPSSRLARDGSLLRSTLGDVAEIIETASDDPHTCLAAALVHARDGLVALLDANGRPTRDATAIIRGSFAAHPDCGFLYTDEEYLDANGQLEDAAFKPAYNPHLLHAMNYMGHLAVMRAEHVQTLGLRPEYEGAAAYDLLIRYLDGEDAAHVLHVPRVTYSGPAGGPGFADERLAHLASQALSQFLGVQVEIAPDRRHLRPIYPLPPTAPLVSIIIPTRDRARLLDTTLSTLIDRTDYRNIEIIIVDNGSVEPETFALFEKVRQLWPETRVIRDDGDFNFSRLCNAGIAASRGDLLLLLNNDMEVIEAGWLGEMVALASLARTGIVGAKLLYPDRSVQHAGFIVGLRSGAGSHWFPHAPANEPGYQDRLIVRQNLSAVTGACLLIRRDCLDAAGPLDEVRFAEECNDVDLCLRARRAGYEVVFTPFACLLHHESASRGGDSAPKTSSRRMAERKCFEEIWNVATRTDPHFSPNLERDNEFALRAPAPRGSRAPRTSAL